MKAEAIQNSLYMYFVKGRSRPLPVVMGDGGVLMFSSVANSYTGPFLDFFITPNDKPLAPPQWLTHCSIGFDGELAHSTPL
jgi:hypothetical protein